MRDIAIEDDISNELKALASSLDEVASFRLYIGCGEELGQLVEQAKEKLYVMKKEKIDSIQLSDNSITQVKDRIIMTSRRLHDLVERSDQMAENGKIEELQTEASELGYQLLKISQYNIDRLGVGIQEN